MFASTLNIVLGVFTIVLVTIVVMVMAAWRALKGVVNNVGRRAGRLFN